jgi:hypothetical protein
VEIERKNKGEYILMDKTNGKTIRERRRNRKTVLKRKRIFLHDALGLEGLRKRATFGLNPRPVTCTSNRRNNFPKIYLDIVTSYPRSRGHFST